MLCCCSMTVDEGGSPLNLLFKLIRTDTTLDLSQKAEKR